MSVELDPELRDDFLAESGELVARLSEQLVSLERAPQDRELLNAIFRGFHTLKGSAGFFDLQPVVRLAHAAEDVFGHLRSGALALDAAMLDAVLEALDALRGMLDAVTQDREPAAAPEELLEVLHFFAPVASAPVATPVAKAAVAGLTDPFSDDEFDRLLDAIQAGEPVPAVPATTPSSPGKGCPEGAGEGLSDSSKLRCVSDAFTPTPLPGGEGPGAAATAAVPATDPEQHSLRVDTTRLDEVMDLVGELVLVRNRLKTLAAGGVGAELRKSLSELDVVTSSLQNKVTRLRMQPIRKLFSRFPRLARDTARKLGKQVELERVGEDTELDKNLVEALADPLMHMVRNAVDHGLELPEVRLAAGKPATGRIVLSAEQAGGQVVVTVSDDGGGIRAERLRAKALERGLITAADAAHMGVAESLQLVFLPGFSTKEQVSDLSGRGVGMDVVRSNILALNGAVTIESTEGQGSTVRIRVPLTLAIQPVMMVERARRLYAIPLQAVQDVFTLDPAQIIACRRNEAARSGRGWDTVGYRGARLPLLWLSRWTGDAVDDHAEADGASRHVVVVSVGNERYGLVAGQVRGREEIVVKPLGRLLAGLAGLAGGTVTSDGRIALILELPSLIAAFESSLASVPAVATANPSDPSTTTAPGTR